MEAELIDKLKDDTPTNCNKEPYKHFNGATIDIDSVTHTLESFEKPEAHSRT